MSGLHTPRQIDTYEAITDLVGAIREFIVNPPDLKPSVEESFAIIKEAKAAIATHQAEQNRLDTISADIVKKDREIARRAEELDNISAGHAKKSEQLSKRETEIDIRNQKSLDREKDVTLRTNDLASRESIFAARIAEVKAQAEKILQQEKDIYERERGLEERESKLREILK